MTEPSIAAATVSIDAIYEKVTVQEAALARIEAALKENTTLSEQRLKATEDRVARQGGRVLELERQSAQHSIDSQRIRSDIRSLEEARETEGRKESRRATWPQIVTAIVAIIGGAGTMLMLLTTLNTIADALHAVAK